MDFTTEGLRDTLKSAVGKDVTRVSFDFQTRLLLEDEWEIIVHATATWTGADGASVTFDGEEARVVAVELIGLRRATLTDVQVDAVQGVLHVAFCSRALTVASDPDHEAWQVNGPRGFKVIASPGGGEPAVWMPRPK